MKDIVYKHAGMLVSRSALITAAGDVLLIVAMDVLMGVLIHVPDVLMNVVEVVQILQLIMHVMDVHLKADVNLNVE